MDEQFNNPTLAHDYENGNISNSSTFEYSYVIEHNHHTKEFELSISEGSVMIDSYGYNTKSDALSDLEVLYSLGVNIQPQ